MPDPDNSGASVLTVVAKQRPNRRFVYLAVVFGVTVFACGSCCLVAVFLLGAKVSNVPKEVDEVASQIADWRLPPGFKGKFAFTFDNSAARFDFAKLEHQTGRGILIVGQWKAGMFQAPDQLKETKQFMDRLSPELKMLDLGQEEVRQREIRGHTGEFKLGKGEDRASTTPFRQVTGLFRGKLDDAVLILQYEEGILTDEEVDEFLDSIK